MITETVEELTPLVGTRPACRALGASVASVYRHRRPPELKAPKPRPVPERALTQPERAQVLEVLHSERFVDVSPEECWATLLDEGTYLCSPSTMYRILRAEHGSVKERRDQLTHPAYTKPELLARGPNELWSWDISKLKAATRGSWFFLYVILDVFSRYIVGWTVRHSETGEIARALIEQAICQQQVTPSVLHADRGAPMRSKHVSELLDDLSFRDYLEAALSAAAARRISRGLGARGVTGRYWAAMFARRRLASMVRLASWIRPAGGSPVRVSAGAPGSRPRSWGEIPGAERGVESLFGGSKRVGWDCSLVKGTIGEPSRSCHGEGHVRHVRSRNGVAGPCGVRKLARAQGLITELSRTEFGGDCFSRFLGVGGG